MHTCSAHPHSHGDLMFNFSTYFGRQSSYKLYSVAKNTLTPTLLCSIPTYEPGYMHSFGMTAKYDLFPLPFIIVNLNISKRYIILVEFPILANPLSMLTAGIFKRAYFENFSWRPAGKTKFYVVSKETNIF
jgi:beta,beta-carotene 9',10'-dioxygenase